MRNSISQCGCVAFYALYGDNAGFQYLRIDIYAGKNDITPIRSYSLPLREIEPNMACVVDDANQLADAVLEALESNNDVAWAGYNALDCALNRRGERYDIYETDDGIFVTRNDISALTNGNKCHVIACMRDVGFTVHQVSNAAIEAGHYEAKYLSEKKSEYKETPISLEDALSRIDENKDIMVDDVTDIGALLDKSKGQYYEGPTNDGNPSKPMHYHICPRPPKGQDDSHIFSMKLRTNIERATKKSIKNWNE